MTTTTQIDLVINKLTKEQYESITPNPTELYLITDDIGITSSDIITALGYTPTQKLVVTNGALTQSGGILTWTITNAIGSTGVGVQVYEVSTGEMIMPDSITVTASTVTIKILSASNADASTFRAVIQG